MPFRKRSRPRAFERSVRATSLANVHSPDAAHMLVGKRSGKSYVRFTELFRWPLALALFALTMELIVAAWRGPLP